MGAQRACVPLGILREGVRLKEYLASAEEVLEEQSTSAAQGLTAAEAQTRLANVGPNKLDEEEKTPLWKRFFEQMADPMVIMLLVAAAISVITGFIQASPSGQMPPSSCPSSS